MRIIFDRDNYLNNLNAAKAQCDKLGVKFSIMLKDFIRNHPEALSIALNSGAYQIWTRDMFGVGYVNYKLGELKKNIDKHNTGIVNKISDLSWMQYISDTSKLGYSCYIPINVYEKREGVSLEYAGMMCNAASKMNGVNIKGYMVNAGCASSYMPKYSELTRLAVEAAAKDVPVSLGGSAFLASLTLPENIEELRIGEYLWLGTVPHGAGCETDIKGKPAFFCEVDILHVDKVNKLIVIDTGYNGIDEDCKFSTNVLRVDSISNEYSVLRYEKGELSNLIIESGKIRYVPSYKTLTRVLIYEAKENSQG